MSSVYICVSHLPNNRQKNNKFGIIYNEGENMKAIVLSGGGSKGAYQIGVWKALRKLHIKYDIVTGTSVGALNAALLVQNKYFKALLFWKNLTFKNVVDENITDDMDKKQLYKTYIHSALNGGMKITNLEKTIDKAINVKKIYASKIDIGLVTIRAKGLKPFQLRKSEIPIDKFKDYLIASASCFPAFTMKEIGNEKYMDGGMYDNLPINLAVSMGATEVIAVDLEEIGIKKKVKNKDIPITYISPNNNIGSFLIFNKKSARRAIKLGYNDTLKKFNELDGEKYTFKKGELKKSYNNNKEKFKEIINKSTNIKGLLEIGIYKKIIECDWETEYYNIIEKMLETFNIDDSYIYDINKINKILINKFSNIKKEKSLTINKIKKIFDDTNSKYVLLFPNEFLMAMYLKLIIENKLLLW